MKKEDLGAFTDERDGKTYKTVKIGNQVWMAENLNYDAPGSKCYDNDPANADKYGRLYDWETAMNACPKGWHLPTDEEWQALADYAGGEETAGKKLKSASGWNDDGNGTDEFGFSALPGGNGYSIGNFDVAGDYGYWWSASEYCTSYAYYQFMYCDYDYGYWGYCGKANRFSVRCVKN